MTMYTCDIFCVTNRKLCQEDFLVRLERIAAGGPSAIILREKDLDPAAYRILAKQVMDLCGRYGVSCILHSFVNVAMELHSSAIHLPMPVLRAMTAEQKRAFCTIGVSCHSTEEAREAEELGCTYITAGHIFETDCKKGLPGRGPSFLREVCGLVSVPVYGIGGIGPENIRDVLEAGAQGCCLMSSLMTCENPRNMEREIYKLCAK